MFCCNFVLIILLPVTFLDIWINNLYFKVQLSLCLARGVAYRTDGRAGSQANCAIVAFKTKIIFHMVSGFPYSQLVSQNKSHLWLAITLTERNLFWLFFLAEVLVRKQATKRLFIFPPHLTSAPALPTILLLCQTSASRCLIRLTFDLVDSQFILMLLCHSLNLVIIGFQLWAEGRDSGERK